jgi:putative phosphotransacetylase
MKVTVGVSNHHVHLTEKDFKLLFGNSSLEVLKKINQPNQFASKSLVTLKGEKGEINDVRVLGPFRNYTQVEISKTDARKLGLTPPVRESGDLKDSSPITLIGPNGTLTLKEGCIIADRHIHMLPKQAELYGLDKQDEVSVITPGEKGGILFHVKLRISENSYFEMHIDTDDANAHLLKNGDIVSIISK